MSCKLAAGLIAAALLAAPAFADQPKKPAAPDKPSEAGDSNPPPAAEKPADKPEEKPAEPEAEKPAAAPEPDKAAEPAKPAEKPAEKPVEKKDERPRLTVRAYEDADLALAESLESASGEVLGRDARVRYRSLAEILEPADRPPRELGRADIMLIDAEKSFNEMDLDKAKELLKNAIQT